MEKRVFLGVGHGGVDPGAIGNGFHEADLNLAIALACESELKRHGVAVKMSRYKDENDSLTEEIKECNAYAPALAVDIHNNAGGGDGVEAYYSYMGGTGKTLAENILAEVVKLGQNSRGAKTRKNNSGTDYYGFIRLTYAPAVIVECAFIDNANDIKIIDTAAEQKAMGVAIAKGILATLGIKYKPESAGVMYCVQVGSFNSKENAAALLAKVKAAGFDGYITTKQDGGEAAPEQPAKKSVDEIAHEVIAGKWGYGTDRKQKLEAEGYDYSAIQKRVNELLKG